MWPRGQNRPVERFNVDHRMAVQKEETAEKEGTNLTFFCPSEGMK